ncbi:MAG: gliding motility-associated C-terminal domain-containing protein, partial [Phaeodactylibacter sp.]|nr:gliding motility-associated C-terminal domain-containing protein [Phaeodactylibacter sp.]
DTWNIILPAGDSPDAYAIKIFDRAGCIIYQSESLAEVIEAVNCPDGVYYYVISPVVGQACSTEVVKGSVTILGNQQ